MKTKALLISTLCLLGANYSWAADEDVTPGHLKFADQAVGSYEFVHYSSQGANPVSPYPTEKLKEEGTVVLTGGQVKNEDASVAGFNKGCHIVASDYGNMLLIKGDGSAEEPTLSAADALAGYINVSMFTQTDFPVNTPVRFHFVSKVVGDPITADYKISVWNFGGATTNVPLPETTTYSSIDTKWWPIYADLNVAGITGDDRILYFATQDAHVPRVPNERFAGKSGMGPRGDVLLQFDWSVGEILSALKKNGLDKNTIIILSSDNGPVVDDGYKDQAVELLGEHKPGGPFRGGKYSSYEAGTRVPCILRWVDTVKPTVSDALVCQIDWFASFASLLGTDLPEGAAPDSENYLDTWLGKEAEGRPYLVEQNAQNNLSITSGEWKYIEPGKGEPFNKNVGIETGNSSLPQLYNLHKDLGEQKNVAEQYPDVVEELAAKLLKIKDGRVALPLK